MQASEGGSITMKQIGEHAVVIGASMGGLLAARALSDFYAAVTVLERDTFPLSDVPRKGVPQGRHAHGLLARGRDVIENFFPGWTDEVVACRRRQGRHRRRRQLDRPWRHHQVGAERPGRAVGVAAGAGRPCAAAADGVAQCARDRELRGAGAGRG